MMEWLNGSIDVAVGQLLLAGVLFTMSIWYGVEAIRLRQQRRRMQQKMDEVQVNATKYLLQAQLEATQTADAYIHRCKEWAADPWADRWPENGDIFADLDEKLNVKH